MKSEFRKLWQSYVEPQLDEVWGALDEHPVFPSEGYKPQIKSELKTTYGDIVSKSSITFTNRR